MRDVFPPGLTLLQSSSLPPLERGIAPRRTQETTMTPSPSTAFFQTPPVLGNQFDEDSVLQDFLARHLDQNVFERLKPGLQRLGERAVTDIMALGDAAEATPPRLVQYDAWGNRIDRIDVSDAWKQLERIAAEEGLVAVGYAREEGAASRLHQFARLYLYAPSSAIFSCPLAMTDGAARAIELYGDDALKARAFSHLTSRDPAQFWTSGQWMTERTGGSDISGTSTIAKEVEGQYFLTGDKWFTSATTSNMAMTLARIEGHPEGSRGLSLFYVELRDSAGRLQNITVHRLKDKLGTRALPTAELSLNGTPATLVGTPLHGVRKIASLFNITRIYNAVCAVSGMRRALALARDYAKRRMVFGKLLSQQPLHVETLARLQLEFEAAFHLTFQLVTLLGKEEVGQATPEESGMLRLLTPVVKLYTAKQGVALASEVLESFGGAGYVEDTGLPRLLRDAQVLAIWEGTTNVLSLDTLRAIEREGAFRPWLEWGMRTLGNLKHEALAASVDRVQEALKTVVFWLEDALENEENVQAGARDFAYSIARIHCAILLLDHAAWHMRQENPERAQRSILVASRWCRQDLTPVVAIDEAWRQGSSLLALDR